MDEQGYDVVFHPQLMGHADGADPSLQFWVYRNADSKREPIIEIDIAYNVQEEVEECR